MGRLSSVIIEPGMVNSGVILRPGAGKAFTRSVQKNVSGKTQCQQCSVHIDDEIVLSIFPSNQFHNKDYYDVKLGALISKIASVVGILVHLEKKKCNIYQNTAKVGLVNK